MSARSRRTAHEIAGENLVLPTGFEPATFCRGFETDLRVTDDCIQMMNDLWLIEGFGILRNDLTNPTAVQVWMQLNQPSNVIEISISCRNKFHDDEVLCRSNRHLDCVSQRF